MFAMILRLNAEGLAVLLVEQNVVQSLDIVHRAYVLENGSFRACRAAPPIFVPTPISSAPFSDYEP